MANLLDRIGPSAITQFRIAELLIAETAAPIIEGDRWSDTHLDLLIKEFGTRRGVIPFIGAGLSVSFGANSWQGFLIENAGLVMKDADVRHLVQNETPDYEQAAELLSSAMPRGMFQTAMEQEFFHRLKRNGLGVHAADLIPHLPPSPIVTTNFDGVLEEIFQFSGEPFEKVLWGAKAEAFVDALRFNRRVLLKIHGDVGDTTDRVLTRSEYKKHYGSLNARSVKKTRPLPHVLHDLFKTQTLLFLGCSLDVDRTQQLLTAAAREYGSSFHYAVLKAPSNEAARHEQTSRLYERNIRAIWVREHKDIASLIAYIIGKTPVDATSSSNFRQFLGSMRAGDHARTQDLGETLVRRGALPFAARTIVGLSSLRTAKLRLDKGLWEEGVIAAKQASGCLPPNPIIPLVLCLLHIGQCNYSVAQASIAEAERLVSEDKDEIERTLMPHLLAAAAGEWDDFESRLDWLCFLSNLLNGNFRPALRYADRIMNSFMVDLKPEVLEIIEVARIGQLISEFSHDAALAEAKKYVALHQGGLFIESVQLYIRKMENPKAFRQFLSLLWYSMATNIIFGASISIVRKLALEALSPRSPTIRTLNFSAMHNFLSRPPQFLAGQLLQVAGDVIDPTKDPTAP